MGKNTGWGYRYLVRARPEQRRRSGLKIADTRLRGVRSYPQRRADEIPVACDELPPCDGPSPFHLDPL